MRENSLTMDTIPADAKHGIEAIKAIQRGVAMVEKKGRKVKPEVLEKIEANDRWATNVILDSLLDDKDPDLGALPNPAAPIVQELEASAAAQAGTATPVATAAASPANPAPNPATAPAPAKKDYVADGDFLFGLGD